jgi:hypothetical protein
LEDHKYADVLIGRMSSSITQKINEAQTRRNSARRVVRKEGYRKYRPALMSEVGDSVTDRDSSVGIGTRYWLDGPGIESQWGGARFSALVQNGAMAAWLFLRVKQSRRGADHPLPSSAEVKEKVELYFRFLSVSSSQVIEENFTFINNLYSSFGKRLLMR